MVLKASAKHFAPVRSLLPGCMAGSVLMPGNGPRDPILPPAQGACIAGIIPAGPPALLLLLLLFLPLPLCIPDPAGAQAPPIPTASAVRLIGTVNSESLSGAVLVDAAGIQSFYRLREKLPDESQIIKVRSDSILLRRSDGMVVELFVTQEVRSAAPAVPVPEVRPAVPGEERKDRGTDDGRRRPHRKERLQQPGQGQ